ncbi:YwqJ-related putative deaminase [Streptomyces sp. ZAF1911]|uniref:YwqJ-related putative deaminase n=1 Tax=Streptomyces sp. ZAF1911 TaxID=2944129 RepID=UPI00237B8DD3|nr:YwqJ-related putative deaminase [Streptomyces sp. ZAF1911]MDD9382555.1 YwqJ-related putative deaminase [Streptomyces sp. ZAF1911]
MQNTATRTAAADAHSGGAGARESADPAGPAGSGGPAGTGGPAAVPAQPGTAADQGAGDPRLRWGGGGDGRPAVPTLRFRRDGILPTVAAALSVRGETLTGTAGKADQPPVLHALVQDFLDTLTSGQRERFTGRCPEAILLSRHLATVEGARSKRASRKPLTPSEARRSLKHSKITARRIREDGDPLHGSYAPPCRSCEALLAHFGVRPVDLSHPE